MIAFQFFYPIFRGLNNAHTILRVKYIKSSHSLSQTLSTLTYKLVWQIYGKSLVISGIDLWVWVYLKFRLRGRLLLERGGLRREGGFKELLRLRQSVAQV